MNYSFTQIRKGIILVEADSQYSLCSMFLRPQEFYESSYENICGKYFSLEEYMDTYAEDKGNFTYFTDWSGFNIPSSVFKSFIEHFKYSMSAKENLLVSSIRNLIPNFEGRFYIIGACKGKTNKETIEHETAHAFWYFDAGYQVRMRQLIHKLSKNLYDDAFYSLTSLGYDQIVVEDEIQAYLATTSRKKILDVLGWRKYPRIQIPQEIKKFFKEYSLTYK